MGKYTEVAVPIWLGLVTNQSVRRVILSCNRELFNDTDGIVAYSPIFPAFLSVKLTVHERGINSGDQTYKSLSRIDLLTSRSPHVTLGKIYEDSQSFDLNQIYISNGLASIVLINQKEESIKKIEAYDDTVTIETWIPEPNGILEHRSVSIYHSKPVTSIEKLKLELKNRLPSNEDYDAYSSYIEQIQASVNHLALIYSRFSKRELENIYRMVDHINDVINDLNQFVAQFNKTSDDTTLNTKLSLHKNITAHEARLIEICAALSYNVTQGVSGFSPVVENPSPFPHHRLLGVGGANRALQCFVLHVEDSLKVNSAENVIKYKFNGIANNLIKPTETNYASGRTYKTLVENAENNGELLFDKHLEGLNVADTVPLITHFSLRHGFKESPVSVTAASESLSHELQPHWTLMTLSHEIMHNRVRGIIAHIMFCQDEEEIKEHFESYKQWIRKSKESQYCIKTALRNVVYRFCVTWHTASNPNKKNPKNGNELRAIYLSENLKVQELIVHFHDYYFVYSGDKEVYFKTIWTSWSKVAAPYQNPEYYLIRSLATAAIGTGKDKTQAYESARSTIYNTFDELDEQGWSSSLIEYCRRKLDEIDPFDSIIKPEEKELKKRSEFVHKFSISYYLLDQFSLMFSSNKLLRSLHGDYDGVEDLSLHNITRYGNGDYINPVHYTLTSVIKSLKKDHEVTDSRWLSAWNSMVISSYIREFRHEHRD